MGTGQAAAALPDGNIVILAKDTLEVASGEENSTRAPGTADARLFPHVQRSPGSSKLRGLTAEAIFSRQAVDMAVAGAECAVRELLLHRSR